MSDPEHCKYLVRVGCSTYNHSRYITDTMNGFALQQTSFPFVCTIIDDASTDGEQDVLKQYLYDYCDLQDDSISYIKEIDGSPIYFTRHKTNTNCYFAVTLLKENHYSQRKSKIPYIADWLDSKYIALCEGDDFWTDPLKLQKQVDYLETHPDCYLCFTNAIVHWEDGSGKPNRLYGPNMEERDYSGPELAQAWISPTVSFVYRKKVIDSPIYNSVSHHPKLQIIGDFPLMLSCCHLGTAHAINEVTCVYRRHNEGFMLSADSNKRILLGDLHYAVYSVFGKDYLASSIFKSLYYYRLGVWSAKKEKNFRNYMKLLGRIIRVYVTHPYYASKRIAMIIKEKNQRISSK